MDVERLINRHKDSVYRQMVRVCGNHTDAEDALAEALLTALNASNQLRDELAFRAWLAKIGIRICSKMRDRERLMPLISMALLEERGVEIPSFDNSPDFEAETREMRGCVVAAVASLPEIYREVYVRREIEGQRAELVASDLNLSIPALKSRLYRAREIVREALDNGICS